MDTEKKQPNLEVEMENAIVNTDVEHMREAIAEWYEKIRTAGMIIGAQYISAAIYSIYQNNLKGEKPSLRDYKRATKEIMAIIEKQLERKVADDSSRVD